MKSAMHVEYFSARGSQRVNKRIMIIADVLI